MNVNMQVNLYVNMNVLDSGYEVTYAYIDVTSWRNAIYPTPAFGRQGHKN